MWQTANSARTNHPLSVGSSGSGRRTLPGVCRRSALPSIANGKLFLRPRNFRHLILRHTDVTRFCWAVSRAHIPYLVRWIWLRVELPEYGCDKCSQEESTEEETANEIRFTRALRVLLGALAKFNDDHPGVTLELSVHSPSDSEHYCQELRNTLRDTMWHVSETHQAVLHPDDEGHGWSNGTRRPLSEGANLRVFGHLRGLGLKMRKGRELPSAGVVKELVIRLQFIRHFSVPDGLDPIIQSLPGLQCLRYECRQGINRGPWWFGRIRHIYLFSCLLSDCINLRELSIYEAGNPSYCPEPSQELSDFWDGKNLRIHSKHLRELHVAWMVDASDFLSRWEPLSLSWGLEIDTESIDWVHLEYLSLTTKLFSTEAFESLLQEAAATAEQMPKLKIMELWGKETYERFFYLAQDAWQHVILMPRGMAGTLQETTIRRWQRAAAIRGSRRELRVEDLPEKGSRTGVYPYSISWKSTTPTTWTQLRMEQQRLAGEI